MALVVAAGVFIGDLIAALDYLLRGEITSRFLAKALVVLLISGGVFFYYFFGLRKPDDPEASARVSRDAWTAAVSAAAVIGMIILGFAHIGAPSTQRILRADQKRVQDLYQLSVQINGRGKANGNKLPQHLTELRGVALADPITPAAYEYHVKDGNQYELCATFSRASRPDNAMRGPDGWPHPAGRHWLFAGRVATSRKP
jgi:hypothetical protein